MDDLIHRQDAIDAVLSVIPNDGYWDERSKEAIKCLPSAQSERKECEEREKGLCPFYSG